MHLVRMSKVMGSLESGRIGWDRWIPLINNAVWELLISGDGAPYNSLWKKLDTAYVALDGADLEAFDAVEERNKRGY